MKPSLRILSILSMLSPMLVFAATAVAQDRPGLFFREDWQEIPAEIPVTQLHVANPDLLLTLYGSGKGNIKKSHHDEPADDPYYIWSGQCEGNWAVTLRHKSALADLSGLSKIQWRTKQSGYRNLRVIVKLYDGAWLVADQCDGESRDWRVREFNVSDLRWRKLDINTVTEGAWVDDPDLTKVDEIGFTDLMRGGGSAACSRLDWVEVWAKTVWRDSPVSGGGQS